MSVRFMSTHVVNTLSFRLYMSHFPTGLVSSKKKIVAMTFAPTFIQIDLIFYRILKNNYEVCIVINVIHIFSLIIIHVGYLEPNLLAFSLCYAWMLYTWIFELILFK